MISRASISPQCRLWTHQSLPRLSFIGISLALVLKSQPPDLVPAVDLMQCVKRRYIRVFANMPFGIGKASDGIGLVAKIDDLLAGYGEDIMGSWFQERAMRRRLRDGIAGG